MKHKNTYGDEKGTPGIIKKEGDEFEGRTCNSTE